MKYHSTIWFVIITIALVWMIPNVSFSINRCPDNVKYGYIIVNNGEGSEPDYSDAKSILNDQGYSAGPTFLGNWDGITYPSLLLNKCEMDYGVLIFQAHGAPNGNATYIQVGSLAGQYITDDNMAMIENNFTTSRNLSQTFGLWYNGYHDDDHWIFCVPPSELNPAFSDNDAIVFNATCFTYFDGPDFNSRALIIDNGDDAHKVYPATAASHFTTILSNMKDGPDHSIGQSDYAGENCSLSGNLNTTLAPYRLAPSPLYGETLVSAVTTLNIAYDTEISINPLDGVTTCLDETPICPQEGLIVQNIEQNSDNSGFSAEMRFWLDEGEQLVLALDHSVVRGGVNANGPPAKGATTLAYYAGSEPGPSSVDDFSINNGRASWLVTSVDEVPQGYEVLGSKSFDDGPWVKVGESDFGGVGRYDISITGGDKMFSFRLVEKISSGSFVILRTSLNQNLADTQSLNPTKAESDSLSISDLQSSILEILNTLTPKIDESEKSEMETQCVIYAPSQFSDDINNFLVRFWEEYQGIGVEFVDTSNFSMGSTEEFRNYLKSSISGYFAAGVEKFHLIGTANEWEEYSLIDMALYPYCESVPQPEDDLIPTWYFYDDLNLAWNRPYYTSDFPYSDVVGNDGLPDVVVTRWPVNSSEGLLARISKVIEYNKGRNETGSSGGTKLLALVRDVDHLYNSGDIALGVAEGALSCIPIEAGVNVVQYNQSDYLQYLFRTKSLDFWNDEQPEAIFMWSPHSSRLTANKTLRNIDGLNETYPALVVAANCLTTSFPLNDDVPGSQGSSIPLAEKSFANSSDRGSIAWIGPTSVSGQLANRKFSNSFIRILYEQPNQSMAESWIDAQIEAILNAGQNVHLARNLRTYNFLGDPLSRLEKKQDSSFLTEITSSALVSQYYGVTNSADWADIDGDGDDDLYMTTGTIWDPYEMDLFNKLVLNNGLGSFCDFSYTPEDQGIDWGGSSLSSAWGDADNDGDPDLYVSSGEESVQGSSTSVLLINGMVEGTGDFVPYQGAGSSDLNDGNPGGRPEWIDIDGDGDLDLYQGRINETALVFENHLEDGSLEFEKRSVPLLSDVVGGGYSAWGDYNNDGLVDVFVFSVSGGSGNRLLENNGSWVFSDVTNAAGPDFSAITSINGVSAAWGDYDNDGDFDLFIGFSGMDNSRLFRNDGGIFADVTEELGLLATGTSPHSIIWSDVDLDSDLDLVIGGSYDVVVWENKLPFTDFKVMEGYEISTPGSLRTVSLSDIDLDGDDDFFLGAFYSSGGTSSGFNQLFENHQTHSANWVKIRLDGSTSNRDGIGSIINVFSNFDQVQTRQLVGSFGGNSHASHTKTIGLGTKEVAKKVRVEWPWGRVTEVPFVQSGQTITISDENAASQIGEIYLTTDPSGSRQGFENPIPQYGTFDLYLVADISDGLSSGYQLGGFEIGVSFPEMIHLSSEQLLIEGINDGDGMIAHSEGTRYDFSVKFTTGTTGDNGIVPLASFSCNISQEGPNPEISLVTGRNNSFQDPIEPSVPCWWESESDVLFRFADAAQSGGIEVPVFDNKAPVCAHAGLWMDYRSFLIVSFDEPINNVCTNGLSSTDVSNFEVYNISNPASFKTIVSIVPFAGDQDFLVILDSDIQEQREYNIKIENFQDWHSNPAGTVIEPVTRNDSGGDDPGINEVLTGGGFAKGGSGAEVIWVELLNNSDSSVCLNGWSLSTSDSMQVTIPDTQVLILGVGEFAVLAGPGQMPEGLDQNIVKFEFETPLELDSGSIAVLDPFGVVVDLVDANVLLKSASFKSVSAQKFEDNNGNAVTWEFDGPEYVPGMTGTPGQENRRSDGSSNNPDVPTMSGLLYAAPNPFNPMTSIYLSILDRGHYSVDVFDIRGRKVKTLFSGVVEPTAKMEVIWNGDNKNGGRVASGTYFVRLRSDSSVHNTLKVTILK